MTRARLLANPNWVAAGVVAVALPVFLADGCSRRASDAALAMRLIDAAATASTSTVQIERPPPPRDARGALECTRTTADALEATCSIGVAGFMLRAGPTAFRAGAGSSAVARGTRVTILEQPWHQKDEQQAREWTFVAATAEEARANAAALTRFLEGTDLVARVLF